MSERDCRVLTCVQNARLEPPAITVRIVIAQRSPRPFVTLLRMRTSFKIITAIIYVFEYVSRRVAAKLVYADTHYIARVRVPHFFIRSPFLTPTIPTPRRIFRRSLPPKRSRSPDACLNALSKRRGPGRRANYPYKA